MIQELKMQYAQKRRLTGQAQERQRRIDQRRADIDSRTNPYTKQIETCEELIAYCNRVKAKAGMVEMTDAEKAAKAQAEMDQAYRRENLEQKLKDGRIQMAQNKKERDDMTVIGGGKKKRNRNKDKDQEKVEEQKGDGQIDIDFVIINKFNIVMMSPPITFDQLDEKIKELQHKTTKLQKEGDAQLAAEKAKLEGAIEQEVDEELAAETAEAMEAYGDEEEEYKASDRPFRAGRGRGARGRGRGGFRQQQDEEEDTRHKRRAHQPKKEFEGSSDEEEEQRQTQSSKFDLYSKPRRGGGQPIRGRKGKKAPVEEEEDFPTLS